MCKIKLLFKYLFFQKRDIAQGWGIVSFRVPVGNQPPSMKNGGYCLWGYGQRGEVTSTIEPCNILHGKQAHK